MNICFVQKKVCLNVRENLPLKKLNFEVILENVFPFITFFQKVRRFVNIYLCFSKSFCAPLTVLSSCRAYILVQFYAHPFLKNGCYSAQKGLKTYFMIGLTMADKLIRSCSYYRGCIKSMSDFKKDKKEVTFLYDSRSVRIENWDF